MLCVVYDSGSLFSPEILDVQEEDLLKKFIRVSDLWNVGSMCVSLCDLITCVGCG